MKNRIIALLLIVFISVTVVGCSNNSGDIAHENLTDNSIEATAEESKDELIKTHDEKHDRYNFAYKRSALSIRKEIFDEYNITNEHIQKFFDIAEVAYDKFTEFFAHERPGVFNYHAIPGEFSEPDLYDDYSDRLFKPHPQGGATIAWAGISIIGANETFYEETYLAKDLSMIDTGFPRIVCHELGHLFITSPAPLQRFSYNPYTWGDDEFFAELAVYYFASEFTVISNSEILTKSRNFYWNIFFGLGDKYGYDTISDTFKGMTAEAINIEYNPNKYNNNWQDMNEAKFKLFKQVLSQKTGDDIEEYYKRKEDESRVIQGERYDIEFTTQLVLSGNLEYSDIESLKDMVNLTNLYLYDNQITDVSVLAGLTNLTQLFLSNNQINDISTLAGLTNLTHLALDGNPISDFSTLAKLTNLTQLVLSDNQISDISMVANLTNLTQLFLNANQISDISLLADLTNLTNLILYDNQISDISPLVKLTNLTQLILGRNQISDISILPGLTNLVSLDLRENPLSAEQIAELRQALPNTEINADY